MCPISKACLALSALAPRRFDSVWDAPEPETEASIIKARNSPPCTCSAGREPDPGCALEPEPEPEPSSSDPEPPPCTCSARREPEPGCAIFKSFFTCPISISSFAISAFAPPSFDSISESLSFILIISISSSLSLSAPPQPSTLLLRGFACSDVKLSAPWPTLHKVVCSDCGPICALPFSPYKGVISLYINSETPSPYLTEILILSLKSETSPSFHSSAERLKIWMESFSCKALGRWSHLRSRPRRMSCDVCATTKALENASKLPYL